MDVTHYTLWLRAPSSQGTLFATRLPQIQPASSFHAERSLPFKSSLEMRLSCGIMLKALQKSKQMASVNLCSPCMLEDHQVFGQTKFAFTEATCQTSQSCMNLIISGLRICPVFLPGYQSVVPWGFLSTFKKLQSCFPSGVLIFVISSCVDMKEFGSR